ncbi:TPM domain-containing protein [Xenorhabdus innexi]|uniref:TPM domain-containing protein n=1 Tax=Xenorhabdus innexi TaxID=290109 RepID=UPI0016453AAE|nr:TPM domain-containing protein [Xenorhabdus innexi]
MSAKEVRQGTKFVEVPALSQSVTDIPNILTKNEHQRLTRQLEKLRSEHKVQMAVLIIPTIGSDSVETFASRVFAEWKLGSQQHNDGILFLVAYDDHKMRIAVGTGLKKQLPDSKLATILSKDAKPAFKEDDYYEGLRTSIDSIGFLVKNAPQEASKSTPAFTDDSGDISDNISSIEDYSAPLIFWLLGMIVLPLAVFRTGGWFKRFLKCASTVAVCTFVLSLVGVFPSLPFVYYLLIFFSPVILVLVVIFLGASLVGGLFKRLFGGSGSGTPTVGSDIFSENIELTDNKKVFSGGGGKSDNNGASDSW